jgi:hypothetical protein
LKNLFGAPNTGLHRYKLLHTAMVDYAATIAAAFALSWATNVPLTIVTVLLFLLAGFLHYFLCVPTDALQYLGLQH